MAENLSVRLEFVSIPYRRSRFSTLIHLKMGRSGSAFDGMITNSNLK
jgi:hypothetical protein